MHQVITFTSFNVSVRIVPKLFKIHYEASKLEDITKKHNHSCQTFSLKAEVQIIFCTAENDQSI